jgi:hypothetical protein
MQDSTKKETFFCYLKWQTGAFDDLVVQGHSSFDIIDRRICLLSVVGLKSVPCSAIVTNELISNCIIANLN